ncbi:MAG: ABC transporter ATP-binding protein [Candidatus Hodarchaeales archaeon]|jgi:ABC-2 type transport system ATP-binding protein
MSDTEFSNNGVVGLVDHVTKSFGEVVAVSDVSFSIQQGHIMGFIGPNGSGKTTSIRMLLGLTKPQSGIVRLLGEEPFFNNKMKQIVGYMPEKDLSPRWITANDYLTSLGRYQLPKEVAKKRAKEVLEELDLTDVAKKKISQFSKGMKQRMKVAQALMHKPQLVIADEPFNGLDPVIRKNLFNLFEQYREENNTTFFISSHILFEVERLADQIVLLYKGRAIAQGSPRRIRALIQEQPHSIQIASPASKQLAKLLIDHSDYSSKLISSIQFLDNPQNIQQDQQLVVLTHQPTEFYSLVTDLVVEHDLLVREIKATDEGLENLFMTLTVG